MNSKVLSKQQEKYPLWMAVLFIVALMFALTSLGSIVYKKWFAPLKQQKHQSALVIQQQLITNQTDAIDITWLRTLNPLVKDVEGRLAWSNTMQKGILEFNGLPSIPDNQHYQLWIYDLIGENTKPIFAIEFNDVNKNNFIKSFSPAQPINSPFKFELMLKTDGELTAQPLFMAQL